MRTSTAALAVNESDHERAPLLANDAASAPVDARGLGSAVWSPDNHHADDTAARAGLAAAWRRSEVDLGGANVLKDIDETDGAGVRSRFNCTMVRRLRRLWALSLRRGCCCSRDGSILAAGLVVVLLGAVCNTMFFLLYPRVISAIQTKSMSAFIFSLVPVLLVAVLAATLNAFGVWIGQRLAIRMRATLTRHVHFRYLSRQLFYRLAALDGRIDNPDMRIVVDVKNFVETATSLLLGSMQTAGGVFAPVLQVLVLGFLAVTSLGPGPVAIVIVIFALASFVSKLQLNKLVPLLFRQDRVEGDLRRTHVHVREHAESIAFFSSQPLQHRALNLALRRALAIGYAVARARLPLNVTGQLTGAFVGVFAVIVPGLTFFAFGGYRREHAQVPNTPQQNTAIFDSSFAYLSGFGYGLVSVFAYSQLIANLAGFCNRLGELLEVLDDLAAKEDFHLYQLSCSSDTLMIGNTIAADFIAVEGVTCVTPDGVELVRDLTFKLAPGDSMLITGPSGVGKSSILRVIGGLWPVAGSGTIARPSTVGRDGLFYLPQRAYVLHGGSLAEQLAYPKSWSIPRLEPTMVELLGDFGLAHLIQLEVDALAAGQPFVKWDAVLSGGEKQRLSMARLFWHGPRFAICDECTSAVDEAWEDYFYTRCVNQSITVLSVAHSLRVRKYHRTALVLNNTRGYSLMPIAALPDEQTLRLSSAALVDAANAGPAVLTTPLSQVDDDANEGNASGEPVRALHGLYPITEHAAHMQEPLGVIRAQVDAYSKRSVTDADLDAFWPYTGALSALIDSLTPARAALAQGLALGNRLWPRMRRLLRLAFPNWLSGEGRLVALGVALALSMSATAGLGPLMITSMAESISNNDSGRFLRFLTMSVALSVTGAIASSALIFVASVLAVRLRKGLTRFLHLRYMRGQVSYVLNTCASGARVDNPDQRMTDDARLLCERATALVFQSELYTGVVPLVPGIVLTLVLAWSSITWIGVVMAVALASIGALVARVLGAPLVGTVFQQDRLEGDLRFAHMRLRDHAESIAFLAGHEAEHHNANRILALALGNSIKLARQQLLLGIGLNIQGFMGAFWGFALPGILVFTGHREAANVGTQFLGIYSYFSSLYGFSQSVWALADIAAAVCGHCSRLGDALDVMDLLDAGAAVCRPPTSDPDCIALDSVSVRTPDNVPLARRVTLRVPRGDSVFIAGASGLGKTSLLRVAMGLWAPESGTVARPSVIGRDGVFLLPQAPLLVPGTLRDQLVYPLAGEDAVLDETEMRELLAAVRLEHLAAREYATTAASASGPSSALMWETMLSGGEKQRLSFARLLWHRPAFAVLDEATSALGEDDENALYQLAVDRGIALLSVSHRSNVRRFHRQLLEVLPAGAWRLSQA